MDLTDRGFTIWDGGVSVSGASIVSLDPCTVRSAKSNSGDQAPERIPPMNSIGGWKPKGFIDLALEEGYPLEQANPSGNGTTSSGILPDTADVTHQLNCREDGRLLVRMI